MLKLSTYLKQTAGFMLGLYSSCSLISTATAGTMGEANSTALSPWWYGAPALTLGGYLGNQGRAQDIPIVGLIGDHFTLTQRHDGSFLAGLGYFLKKNTTMALPFNFGIEGFYLGKTTVKGEVIQEDLFANLSYQYRLRHIPVYALARTTLALFPSSAGLELDAGIGPNFIRASGFGEASIDGGITLPDNIFKSQSRTVFSATAGVSVVLPSLSLYSRPVSCGYRFFYLGKGRFKTANDQVGRALDTGTTYANALACTLTL